MSRSLLPGFPLTLGITLLWLGVLVLLPLAALALKGAGVGWDGILATLDQPRVRHAILLSFGLAFLAALIDLVWGLLVAWVLVRYRFWGRGLVDALVDLPFALPTAVAGIALATLYAPRGWIGQHVAPGGFLAPLFGEDGLRIAFTPLGILVALVFIGLPFVVRTVQPVLESLPHEVEEAAASLGARPRHIFWRIILPALWPALLTGFALAFARTVGEYGSVVFISGNLPGKTEILPLIIIGKLEQHKEGDAVAVAVLMLAFSFVMLLVLNLLQRWAVRRQGQA